MVGHDQLAAGPNKKGKAISRLTGCIRIPSDPQQTTDTDVAPNFSISRRMWRHRGRPAGHTPHSTSHPVLQHVRLAYQPLANSTFLSEQTSH
jgi:hypothetical protein